MSDIIQRAGLYTDQQNHDYPSLKSHGYDWISFQVVNENDPVYVKERDLRPAFSVGLDAGVWGVVYDKAHFFRDGAALGEQAIKLGAQHLGVDAEECAKFTRDSSGLAPIIRGIQSAGWHGPVHLCTLGAPSNPRTKSNPQGNDFGIDTKSFTDTGGGVIHQDYFNITMDYHPIKCVAYWEACGIPASRQNVMIEVNREGNVKTARDYIDALKNAGVKRNLSVFMAEFMTDDDLAVLEEFTKRPPAPDSQHTRQAMIALASAQEEQWKAEGRTPSSIQATRIHRARKILES